MADADPQAVELAVPEQAHGVAQAVLAAVAAVELEPRRARRQVQFVVRQQRFFRLDLPVAQRRGDRLAAEVHERGRLQQPHRLAGDVDLGGLAEQLAISSPKRAPSLVGERVHKPEPGVVPGPGVFGSGIAQPDDEAQASHRAGTHARRAGAAGAGAPARRRLLLGVVLLGDLGRRHFGRDRRFRPASSTSSLPCLAMTTATSCSLPSFSSGSSTPFGSLRSDRWTMSPTASVGQVDLDELRQVLRQAADCRLR